MKVKESESYSNAFESNYHGLLDHDGWIKVAKANVKGEILFFDETHVRVKSKTGKYGYNCNIHKDIRELLYLLDIRDEALIKWKSGEPYFVGFRKRNHDKITQNKTADFHVSENTNWLDFFRRIDAE